MHSNQFYLTVLRAPNQLAMGRMYGIGKGFSSSATPFFRVPPKWLNPTSQIKISNLCLATQTVLQKLCFKDMEMFLKNKKNFVKPFFCKSDSKDKSNYYNISYLKNNKIRFLYI